MVVLVVIQTVLVALLGLLVVSLLRSHAAILRRLHDAGHGLDDEAGATTGTGPVPVPLRTRPGVPVPGAGTQRVVDVVGNSPAGSALSVAVGGRRPTLLAFLSSGCATCSGFWRAFAEGVSLPGELRLVVVVRGDEAEDRAAVAALAPRGVVVVQSSAAWADYEVPASPYFVLVGSGRVLGEGAALTWEQVHGLLERALATEVGPGRRPRGQQARLRDTDEELLAAGLRPGDASLYPAGDASGRDH